MQVLVVGPAAAAGAGTRAAELAGQLRALPVVDEVRFVTVAELAGCLRAGGGPAAVVDEQLVAHDAALLRLLDDPRLVVAALVAARPGAGHPVATQGSTVLSAGSARHPVPDADGEFLGALHLAGAVRAVAADAVAGAADLDAALTALARDPRLPAAVAVRPEPFVAVRTADPERAAAARAAVAADADALRAARVAARPGDGLYSTFVLRRLSRRITPWAVRRGIAPNTITWISAALGVGGAAAFGLGAWPALVAGAVLLQVSLVLDCVDGEVARATRRTSAFGSWLDGATDRIKEYGALAGLAAARPELWTVAATAMAVQTVRHLRDFSFDKGVVAAWRAGMRDRRPLTDTGPWQRPRGAGRGPEPLTGPLSFWLRRGVRFQIAERWLVLSVLALADQPRWALLAYLAGGVAAEAWALAGALRRARTIPGDAGRPVAAALAAYRDDGLLATGRVPSGVPAWLLPPLTFAVEGAVVIAAAAAHGRPAPALAFGWLAAVVWHRYDLAYRRGAGSPVPAAVDRLGLGWAVRSVVVGGAALAGALPAVLAAGTAWLVVVYLPESVRAGVRAATSGPPDGSSTDA